jgi:hypothetical protein
MTVARLVSLFESIEQEAAQTEQPRKLNHRSLTPPVIIIEPIHDMSARKMKLSLHTMFNHDRSRSQSRPRSSRRTSRTPSGLRSPLEPSPSPAYAFLSRPYTPTSSSHNASMLSPPSSTNRSPASSLNGRPYIRRQPSAVDLALEAERFSVGPENIGLGLLEPRPRAASSVRHVTGSEGMCSLMEVLGESRRSSAGVIALDGIFEVLERGR